MPGECLNANASLATALFQKRALTPWTRAHTTLRNAPKFRLAHCEFEHFGCACLCTTWYPAHSHPFTELHELLARSSYRSSALVLPIGLQWAPVRFLTLTAHQSFVISAASGPLPLIYIAASTPPRNGVTTAFPSYLELLYPTCPHVGLSAHPHPDHARLGARAEGDPGAPS